MYKSKKVCSTKIKNMNAYKTSELKKTGFKKVRTHDGCTVMEYCVQ